MGVWSVNRGLVPLEKTHHHRLVFLGHLLEKQGVQLIIKAVPKICEKIPDFEVHIIGTGPYETYLKKLTEELGIEKKVTFFGMVESHKEVDRILSESALAAAPYDVTKDTWTYWADPGKLKNYFAASLPVILTNVSFNAKEIAEKKCGILINFNVEEFVEAVCRLMLNDQLLCEYRANAYLYSNQYDWELIFNELFHAISI